MTESLDDIFSEEVLSPWQRDCSRSLKPWRATDSLKKRWLEMIRSQSADVALCGAMALSRVSSLEENELEELEIFFNQIDSLASCSPDLVASMLLSGASPPHLFLQSYISLALSHSQNSTLWSLLSSYVRHPHSASFDSAKMFRQPPPKKIAFLLNANPARKLDCSSSGVWETAQNYFRGPRRQLSLDSPELLLLAQSLRADWGAGELRSWVRSVGFSREIKDGLSLHPGLSSPVPELDHRDPSIHAINFFSGDDPVSRVWRFYNPLLIMPWLMDPAAQQESEVELLGTLLLGAPLPSMPLARKRVPFLEAHPLASISP